MLVPRVCSIVSVHVRGGVQPFSLLHPCILTELERWQRRCDRLTQLQRRIRFPPLRVLAVDGKDIKLPLPAVEAVHSPSQEELEYLVGFFDGDGCVSMNRKTGDARLVISQNVDSANVLLHFRSLLGGSISRQAAPTGSQKATLRWQVCGSKMSAAAETLSRIPSMKQAQLLMAKQGYIAEYDTARVGECLKMFKRRQHVPDRWSECSWPYFAGFFDAEGSITVVPASAGLQVRLAQVNSCVLMHLLRFLHEKGLRTWSLYHGTSCSSLVCANVKESKKTLELLLAHGLLVKQKQANLALSLSAENHLQIRDAISSLNGLQGRYKRLDSEGIARAREIQRLQNRLRYLSGPERGSMLSKLGELRAEHNLQKLISRCDLLRKDMRQSLREGGQVVS